MGDTAATSNRVRFHRMRAIWDGALDRLGLDTSLVRYAALVWGLSRLGFVVVTELALHYLRHISAGAGQNAFVNAWARFDATYYARLAHDGYQRVLFQRTAFFPLQPLATHFVIPLVGGDSYLAGIVVANASYFFALLGLGALARQDGDSGTARRAMLYLTLFPTALFLFAGYAESLFLALAIWCVVALRRRWWWQAGILGLLATLTRQMGLFLVLPFAYEYATYIGWRVRAIRPNALAVLLIPSGLLLFMGWLWHAVGDPLAFVHAEKLWGHTFVLPWMTLWSALPILASSHNVIFIAQALADFGAVVLFAMLVLIGVRRLPPGETLYSAAVWLLAVCYPAGGWPLQSDARYMLAAFPCFLTLAHAGKRTWLNVVIVVAFGFGLLILTQYYVRGAVII